MTVKISVILATELGKKMKRLIQCCIKSLFIGILISGFALGGCAAQSDNPEASSTTSPNNTETTETTTTPDSTTSTTTETTETTTTPDSTTSTTMNSSLPRLEGKAIIELKVNGSPITIEVNGNDAPITAGNFVDLVQRGVYNGLAFHRVVKDPQPFVAQGGDPQSKNPSFPVSRLGTGGYIDPDTGERRFIPLEIKLEGQAEPTYSKGLGQQSGFANPPVVLKHTHGAVAMARSQAPDSASSQFYIALADLGFLDGDYAVFGYVTKGMDVVDRIKQGDRIESAKILEGAENLKK
jgi:peptidyl-prolyl cis-trans isomerase B (cyclophilin B)